MGQLGHLVRREQFLGQNYFEGLAYLPVRQNKNVTFLFQLCWLAAVVGGGTRTSGGCGSERRRGPLPPLPAVAWALGGSDSVPFCRRRFRRRRHLGRGQEGSQEGNRKHDDDDDNDDGDDNDDDNDDDDDDDDDGN